ncbi:hypothetical protein N8214_03435 [Pseudomonadales bacterium]|nr:hypothetical protein [Pseudomonadales bacterium]
MRIKKFYYVRQSAVIADSSDISLFWREEKICLKASMDHSVELLFSSFDHYTKTQREDVKTQKAYRFKSFFTPGYKKHTGILRIIDSFLFFLQVTRYLLQNASAGDVVVYAIPTIAPVLITRILRLKGVAVLFDFRDAWPGAVVDKSHFLYPFFCRYIKLVFSIAGAKFIRSVAMSDTLANYYAEVFDLERVNITTVITRRGEYKFNKLDAHTVLKKYLDLERGKYIFFAGSLVNLFDWDISFNLFSTISENFDIVIAGDGPLFDELKERALPFDNIKFVGRISAAEVRILSSYSYFNFCFYRGCQFRGHITNKILEYADSPRPFLHNLGPFYINGYPYHLGLEYDPSLPFVGLVGQLDAQDYYSVNRQFFDECDRTLSKGLLHAGV